MWFIKLNLLVSNFINKCVFCKKKKAISTMMFLVTFTKSCHLMLNFTQVIKSSLYELNWNFVFSVKFRFFLSLLYIFHSTLTTKINWKVKSWSRTKFQTIVIPCLFDFFTKTSILLLRETWETLNETIETEKLYKLIDFFYSFTFRFYITYCRGVFGIFNNK